ncbi:MAG: hypothetical protein M3378_10205 [Actinomycetota bacterium]|nr:hypothetical protein [Actinomycetota bacterium]
MPDEEQDSTEDSPTKASKLDVSRTIGPRRDPPEELAEEPLGDLSGHNPSSDSGSGPRMPPEAPTPESKDESETVTPP